MSGSMKVKLSSIVPGMTMTATVTKVCHFLVCVCFVNADLNGVIMLMLIMLMIM